MTPTTTRTAHEAYLENLVACKRKLDELHRALAAHKREEAADPRNWGYAGDLGHVNEKLGEVLDFLSR